MIAKLTNPETVGHYALALSITAPVMLLANLNLRAIQATDTRQDYRFCDYFALRVITTLIALVVIGIILLVTRFDLMTDLVIVFIGLAKAAESMSDAFYGMMQQHEKMDFIARSMLLRGSASLLVMVVTIGATGSIVYGSAALFLTWVGVLIAYDNRIGGAFLDSMNIPKFTWRIDKSVIVSLAVLSLPLGLVQLLISLNSNIPRYFLQGISGNHELGIFAALTYLVAGASTGVVAICNAASPRLARLFQEGDFAAFNHLITKLVLLFAGGSVVAVLGARIVGEWVLTHVYTDEYSGSSDVLVIMTVSFGLGAIVSILGYGLTASRSFKSQVPLVGVATVTTFLGCALMIPRFGLMGAAITGVVSEVVWMLLIAITLYRVVKRARAGVAHQEAAT